MGVLLGLTRPNSRSPRTRVYDLKPFYRGAKITVIEAVSLKQVLAVMTLNGSMDAATPLRFYQRMLSPKVMVGCSCCHG